MMTCECLVGAKCDHERRCTWCGEIAVEHDVVPKHDVPDEGKPRPEDLCEVCLEEFHGREERAKQYQDGGRPWIVNTSLPRTYRRTP